jgi:hypothetical protein
MSNSSLSGALPKGDANGLGPIVRDLIDDPHHFHVVMAIIDCKQVKTNFDTGEVVPTARIRRIEVMLPADLGAAQKLMRRSLEHRTGRTVLPLDLEDDIQLAFGQIDPRTGEKKKDDDSK